MSRARLLLRTVHKDEDTSNLEALTFPWRVLDFFVVPKWFLCTGVENDDTSVFLALRWIPSRNFFSTSLCVSNLCHLY